MKLSEVISEHGDIEVKTYLKILFYKPLSTQTTLEKEIIKWCGDHKKDFSIKVEIIPTPKKQKIDLSRLIESQLDCEFSDSWKEDEPIISKLKKIEPEVDMVDLIGNCYIPSADFMDGFPYCRPRMNHIHACPDGFIKCPLPKGFRISVQFKDDSICNLNTSYSRPAYSIGIAWKCVRYIEILGVSDGWEL